MCKQILLSKEKIWLTPSQIRFDVCDKWYAGQPSEASHISVQYLWFYTTFSSRHINLLTSNLPWNELRAPSGRLCLTWIQFDRICCLCTSCFIIHFPHIISTQPTMFVFPHLRPICIWLQILWKCVKLGLDSKNTNDQMWSLKWLTMSLYSDLNHCKEVHLDFCATYWTCAVALLFSVGVADSVCLWMWRFWAKAVAFAGILLRSIKICMDNPGSLGSISGPRSHVALLSGPFSFSAAMQVFTEAETLALMYF